MEISSNQMALSLTVGIITLIVLILWTRIHAFPALLIAAILTGIVGGMGFLPVMESITKGFGSTLGSIGLIIGLGIMMGELFEISGAAKRMAKTFISFFGKGREEIALAVTGFIVSVPIFCDSGFVILSPLAKAISRRTGKSVITLGVALAAGLVVTHHLVPPTPGPVAAANNFGVSIGVMLIWGVLLAIPVTISAVLYARYIGNKIFRLPALDGEGYVNQPYPVGAGGKWLEERDDDATLPSAFMSFLPILAPVGLIVAGTLAKMFGLQGVLGTTIQGFGHPVVAVGIGLLIAIYGLTPGRFSRDEVVDAMDKSVRQAGIILFVTGAGGALGAVLRDSGAAKSVAEAIATLNLLPILLPLIIATIVRLLQGSGTVSMITASSIVAPMAPTLELDPVLGALACCAGSLFFGYFNDSYFWVVNRILGVSNVKEQIKIWSVTTTICWAVASTILIIASFIV
ncbi:GntP family permease [Desulfovibrio litoralis]|uniref:Gluconate:H+ symporter, GntP family n=1 Tax=Desulfovibrio litoralis DSM 11393 TaxID=1121455 RepID=A0A1M7TMD9_9BACT|nr:gluconate:H+ symporter [Desulfovibrio litoralis]SHN71931.1 gluconate:H+ symporter, GntP family [Desulfovibrio litoralis DSM 11393]